MFIVQSFGGASESRVEQTCYSNILIVFLTVLGTVSGPRLVERSKRIEIMKWDIVIARYREDISWIRKPEFDCFNKFVYNKGPPDDFGDDTKVFNIPNVGRECHTFLYHIVENYDSIADLTVFVPGSCMDELKVTSTKMLLSRVHESGDTVLPGKWYSPDVVSVLRNFKIASWSGTNDKNRENLPQKKCRASLVSPFGSWFKNHFGNVQINVVCFNSMFAVSKSHVRQKPSSHYSLLLNCLNDHSNPEDGHFMERSWQAVFYPIPVSHLETRAH